MKAEANKIDIHKARFISNKAAFTLIELTLVILIISIASALIMPVLWDSGERSLKSEAKRIANTLRYVYDEAAGKKMDYVLKIDIDGDTWGFESENESRTFNMKKDVMFKDILVPSHGNIVNGQLEILFGPLGPQEPVTVHLIKDDAEFTIKFNHLNGRAKVLKGYVL